jgi:pimeloyl-ACP methyl ester carboxylesterase
MTDFVLMHGGGMGGWTWKFIRPLLRAQGHEIFSPSFTGFAERSHLMSRDTRHDVHVEDVAALLHYEDLHDVVLIAHSYAGTVAPGVIRAQPGQVKRAIYLDALVAKSGERVVTAMGFMPEEQAAGLDAMLARGEGPIGSGVHEQQRAMAKDHPHLMDRAREQWLLDHLSDMPLRCTVSPIATGAEAIDIPVDYVAAEHTIMQPMHARAAALGWTMHRHSGDHALLVGDPEGVADLILKIAG